METEVHFESDAFNTKEPRPYFINRSSFGDDVCRWLIGRLHEGGVLPALDEPRQEDFGWWFELWAGGERHRFVVGRQPGGGGDAGRWIGWLERAGPIAALTGRRVRGVDPRAVAMIDGVLRASPLIREVSWHRQGEV